MIHGGHATIHVSDLDEAVRFYTGALGLTLTHRLGASWALLRTGASYWTKDDVGAGLVIGLRPQAGSASAPAPGTNGSVTFGLESYVHIEQIASDLREAGVRVGDEIIRSEIGNFVTIHDMDGNGIYLWEIAPDMRETGEDGDEPVRDARTFFGGHVNIYVSNMDRAVDFYTDVLGLRLTHRFGDNWATVEAGRDLVVGLHPASPKYPPPGTGGAVVLSLTTTEPLQKAMARFAARGVRINGATQNTTTGHFVMLGDSDGNQIALQAANSSLDQHAPVTTHAHA